MDENIYRQAKKKIAKHNKTGRSIFENYSPNEMQHLIYDLFGEKSPIQWINMDKTDYKAIPMFIQIKYLTHIIKDEEELKLTQKGHLRTKLVADIYKQGFIKDEAIESGITKLYKETDANAINLTRILLEISPIVKKRHNKLSLTQKGRQIIKDDHKFLLTLLKAFFNKFNWAYYDGYTQNQIGRMGVGFTFILISKYGNSERPASFYAEKYFNAFSHLLDELSPDPHMTNKERGEGCYTLRTFDRFLNWFGLVNVRQETYSDPKYILKTDLFDKLIKCRPPMNA